MERGFLMKNQFLPVSLTVIIAILLIGILWIEIVVLNQFTSTKIITRINVIDIFVGLTIYLKTSIDFAIFIGRLMDQNPGWKSRIAIEIGTAAGNAAGTFAILLIWAFFKEIRWLLAIMIFLAALVLFKLAEESLEHAKDEDKKFSQFFRIAVDSFEKILGKLNGFVLPALKYIIPNVNMRQEKHLSFWPLFSFSFTIPFILGLDDFAGYVPLFNVVNVFGFAIGVFLGHMILNMLLYISPARTVKAVKHPVLSFLGSVAFTGLGVWGIMEVVKLIGH